jgi:hypothetical protein
VSKLVNSCGVVEYFEAIIRQLHYSRASDVSMGSNHHHENDVNNSQRLFLFMIQTTVMTTDVIIGFETHHDQ